MIDLRLDDREVRIEITGFDAFLLDVRSLWRGRRWGFAIPLEHVVEVKSPGFDPKDTPLGLRTRAVRARPTRRPSSEGGWNGWLRCVRRRRRPTIDLKLADEPYEMVSLSVPDAQAKARAIKDAVRQIRPASLAMVDDLNRGLEEKRKELVREGKISEERFEETTQEARAAGLVYLRHQGELNDEEYARLKRQLLREGKISEGKFEEIVQEARTAGLVDPHERGELNEEDARLKRELAEGG
jgi:polyhydroxyalkanoate synthesis regulator phasin